MVSGKTVLTSEAVESVKRSEFGRDPTIGIAFFYFRHEDHRNIGSSTLISRFLGCILKTLYAQNRQRGKSQQVPESVRLVFEENKKLSPSYSDLLTWLFSQDVTPFMAALQSDLELTDL